MCDVNEFLFYKIHGLILHKKKNYTFIYKNKIL